MILTDYLKAEKTDGKKYRFDITASTDTHDYLSGIIINKRNPNQGGESFNLVPRPEKYKDSVMSDKAITKGSYSISSIYIPDIEQAFGFGDINGTNDAIIFCWELDKENNIIAIELFIARGQKHNKKNLYFLFSDSELVSEVEDLKSKSVPKIVTDEEGQK